MISKDQIVKQVEVIHTSLLGLALIAIVLLAGMLLPVFGLLDAIHSPEVAGFVVLVSLVGIITLYAMNYIAHKFVLDQARLTDVLINSLGQGFLTFDRRGVCGHVYSQACLTLLETDEVDGRSIAALLNVPRDGRQEFQEWLELLFTPGHVLSFEDGARFLPVDIPRHDGRTVALSYRPIYNNENKQLECIVLIATDRTEEVAAQKRADEERKFAAMICAVMTERQNFMLTMAELKELLDHLLDNAGDKKANLFLRVHTLKGAAMHFRMESLSEKLHNLETVLRESRELQRDEFNKVLQQSRAEVQVEFGRIQNVLHDIVGDVTGSKHGILEVDEDSIYQFGRLLEQQGVSPDLIAAYKSSILSVPLFALLGTLDRQMVQVAERLEKKIKPIKFTGDNLRVASRPMQHLLMAMTHVVHNILDHGIEAPITRTAKNKDPEGQVTIHVTPTENAHGRWIEMTISDDGAGIDPERVRERLSDIMPQGDWRNDDDHHVIQRLLTHDISTKTEVSMLSGRGAGMSAIYQEVVRLGGSCELRSVLHQGTQLIIRLPQSLAA